VGIEMDELEYTVNPDSIRKAVQSGIPLDITTYTLPHDMEVKISQTIASFLDAVGMQKIKDYVGYCISELAVNAKKANTKRVYFAEKGYDINNPSDYKAGMASFKKDTIANLPHYLQLQKDQGLYIKVVMRQSKELLFFEVSNNVQISRIEQVRIYEKLTRSRQYNSMEDAFGQIMDDSEGAGLGIVVMVLMLKKMGLDEDCFNIEGVDGKTIAKLVIPMDQTKVKTVTALTQTIVKDIDSLPQFPQNIISVQKLLEDPKSEMSDIARLVSTDPAMTADILKLVNSAQYAQVKRVNNIAEAATILGIKGIKNLLYSYGTQKILGDESEEQKKLWEHSYKTAFYAYNVVKNFSKNRAILDDVYVVGMLHDMGKIVFSKSQPELINKIKSLCEEKTLSQITLENLSAGMNHAEIGALIAEKWNFPAAIVTVIRFHHDPLSAPPEFIDLVGAVYIANMMCLLEEGFVIEEQFNSTVLARFGLSKSQLKTIQRKFTEGFKQKR
jgi:putative nucleotidyltransferase with HDIG domain